MAADLDAIRASVNLPEMIGRAVALKRRGKSLFGLCPFHAEKTPSFQVYIDHYYCHGCGAFGDCVDWVRHVERCDFIEAIAKLTNGNIPQARRETPAERRERMAVAALAAKRAAVLESYRDNHPNCECPDWLLDVDAVIADEREQIELRAYLQGR